MNFAGCAGNTSKDSGDTTQNQQKETEDSGKNDSDYKKIFDTMIERISIQICKRI